MTHLEKKQLFAFHYGVKLFWLIYEVTEQAITLTELNSSAPLSS